MPKSMTGFSKVEMENGEGKCYGEARSLNSRYLEISLKLPRNASGYESRLREMAKRIVKRGRLDVTIKWDKGDEYGCRAQGKRRGDQMVRRSGRPPERRHTGSRVT